MPPLRRLARLQWSRRERPTNRVCALAERGIDVDLGKLDPAQFNTMLRELGDFTIDVDEGHQQVRITCE